MSVYSAFGTVRCANPPVHWSPILVLILTRLSKSSWIEVKKKKTIGAFLCTAALTWQEGTQTSKEDHEQWDMPLAYEHLHSSITYFIKVFIQYTFSICFPTFLNKTHVISFKVTQSAQSTVWLPFILLHPWKNSLLKCILCILSFHFLDVFYVCLFGVKFHKFHLHNVFPNVVCWLLPVGCTHWTFHRRRRTWKIYEKKMSELPYLSFSSLLSGNN